MMRRTGIAFARGYGHHMPETRFVFGGAAIALVLVNIATAGVVLACLRNVEHASEQNEGALVTLVDDVTRASQAQAAAERMIAVGRGYLLTHEPALLARAQAAEAKLTRTIQTIVSSASEGDERRRLDGVVAAAKRYRNAFGTLLSGEKAPHEPREVADALRRQLIPARDELVVALDGLVEQRLQRMEDLRSAGRARRARTVELMTLLGIVGVVASVFLVWTCARQGRSSASLRSIASLAGTRPPNQRSSRPTNQFHRPPSARSRS